MESVRGLIETLKWLDFKDLLECGEVSALYLKVARCDEVWRDLCELYSIATTSSAAIHTFRDGIDRATFLYLLKPTEQLRFNCRKSLWTVLNPTTLSVSWSSSYVILERDVLISGGKSPDSNQSLLYRPQAGKAEELSRMQRGRGGHGLVYFDGVVYAFGGDPHCFTCEKYHDSEWRQMADMHSKHSWFTPVAFAGDIYLLGGVSTTCELFHPITDLCEVLSWRLPEASEVSVCCLESKLVVIQRSCACEAENHTVARTVSRKQWGSCWTNQAPLVVGCYAFLIRQTEGSVRKFSLQDLASSELVKVSNRWETRE